MKRCLGLLGTALAAVVAASVLANCGGGTGGSASPRNPQFVLRPVGTASNSGTFVMGLERSSIDANNSDTVQVFARVFSPSGRPLGGVAVTFQASFCDVTLTGGVPLGDCSTGTLPSVETLTDGTGTAVITARAGGTPGRLVLQAFTSNINMNLGGAIFLNLTDVGFISGNLQVLPAEIDVTDPLPGTVLQFLVTGGRPFQPPSPPYVLQNGVSGVGVAELLDDGEFPVVIRYTVSGMVEGAHVFTVVDADGTSVSGTVMVEFTELTIVPSSVSLAAGQSQSFAITGGVPPYTCTPSGGTLNPTTILERGGTTVFTAGDVPVSTTFTIICTDVSGQIASAMVTIAPAPSPTGGGGGTPTPSPQVVTTIIVQPNPSSLNGVQGGTSNIVATVLDQNNDAIPGVNVLFTLPGQSGDPTPTVPSLSPLTVVTNGAGQATSVLTVPAGTAPQFIVITAQARGVMGTGQVGVTSQSTEPPGPPARLNAALFKSNGFGDNNDGTFVTVLSALVTDAEGNPVADGVQVNWTNIAPTTATVFTPSFTNGLPPCDVDPYESSTGLAIVPQPGTALTCVIYPTSLQNLAGTVNVSVEGTSLQRTASFTFPGGPTPTPVPTAPPPTVTPTPFPTFTPTPTP
jgi:hypothetical protein